MGVSYESKVRSVYVLQVVCIYWLKIFLAAVKWAPFVLIEGGEYMSKEFNAFLADRGIKHQCIVPYAPQ